MSQDVRSGGITDGNMRDESLRRGGRGRTKSKKHITGVWECAEIGVGVGWGGVLVSNYQISLPKVELSRTSVGEVQSNSGG